jgi:hypothetical protein
LLEIELEVASRGEVNMSEPYTTICDLKSEITRLRAELEQERVMHAKALEGETLLRLDVIKDNDRLRAELDKQDKEIARLRAVLLIFR